MSNQLIDQTGGQMPISLAGPGFRPLPGTLLRAPSGGLRLVRPAAVPAMPSVPPPARKVDSAFGPLQLRAFSSTDAAAHAAFLESLGEHGRHMRRFALPRVPAQGCVPGLGRPALLSMLLTASVPGRAQEHASDQLLGELCVCFDPSRVAAEFALVVHPALRGRGLGRALIHCLLDLCRARHVALVCALVPAGNPGLLAAARGCGFQALRAADGSAQLALMLRPREVR